jgi:ribonuclease HII
MSKLILLKSHFNEDKNIVEVGLDEAGRGALAGPVTVAACIMPTNFQHPSIRDSKLLSEPQKAESYKVVMENAIAWSYTHVDAETIERINILNATIMGMKKCLDNLVEQNHNFDFIIVDGDQFHGYYDTKFQTIVGGDNKYTSIAAASIIAKVKHDEWMRNEEDGKIYGWASNKGYGTAAHINAIKTLGPSKYHRESFISHLLTKTEQLF